MDKGKFEYYANILNLGYNFSFEDVKKNYLKLVKEYHPDRYVSLGQEAYQNALKKFQEIKEAYEYITKNYEIYFKKDDSINSYKEEANLESYYLNGIHYFKKGDINSALNCFLICHRKQEDNPKYIRGIIRCLFTKNRRWMEALEYCQRLIKIEPLRNENLYLIGKCYYLLKDNEKALFYLKKAREMGYNLEDIENIIDGLEPKSIVKKMLSKFKKS
ncbi:DnaJ domain-containing protein [Calditerrivibrio nitroreducens]|uniref:Heat shock protein DnaJ domain protein n=1 Tax=Calditerrivibrio nitroreducens (strain DSM 19672 / NBRC 101217 / Yu37-1) TaxID=768670 RepID=E4TFB1_CALNY|nr:DnaJ domain-containing protein [Calditerrivibrio nitroreducens]ADR18450.1 heat shock protein DnaJ domain protein [Calditerrivibrio nitroreducens DSM 19672]